MLLLAFGFAGYGLKLPRARSGVRVARGLWTRECCPWRESGLWFWDAALDSLSASLSSEIDFALSACDDHQRRTEAARRATTWPCTALKRFRLRRRLLGHPLPRLVLLFPLPRPPLRPLLPPALLITLLPQARRPSPRSHPRPLHRPLSRQPSPTRPGNAWAKSTAP